MRFGWGIELYGALGTYVWARAGWIPSSNSSPGKVYYSGDLFDSLCYSSINDLYEHLSEEVTKMNRSEQLMAREGLLFWRPL